MGPFLLISLCAGMALTIPVAASILIASALALQLYTELPSVIVVQQVFSALDKFPLAAIPFFIAAGNLMELGGLSERLVDLSRSMVRRIQGGLAIACVLTCMLFSSVSGSSVATAFAVGAILIPAMARNGYPLPWAASLQAASAELGAIIPPSIPMILYGLAVNVSISELFVAAIVPGILVGIGLIVFVVIWSRATGHGRGDRFDDISTWQALRRAAWPLAMPVLILGGIYGGVFTPTEASIVAVLFALFVGTAVYRSLDLAALRTALYRSVVQSAGIMLIIASAGLFGFLITQAGLPAAISRWLSATFSTPIAFLVAVNVMLFVIGMFLETSVAILVLAPILVPVAVALGVDPVHFGVIMIVNLALGMITPPFGVNLFAAASVARISVERMLPHLAWLVVTIVICLMLITFLPDLSLVMRDWVYR